MQMINKTQSHMTYFVNLNAILYWPTRSEDLNPRPDHCSLTPYQPPPIPELQVKNA